PTEDEVAEHAARTAEAEETGDGSGGDDDGAAGDDDGVAGEDDGEAAGADDGEAAGEDVGGAAEAAEAAVWDDLDHLDAQDAVAMARSALAAVPNALGEG